MPAKTLVWGGIIVKKGCEKISHLVSDAFERKLSWLERIEVKIHLSMCSLCNSYAQNIAMLQDVSSYLRQNPKTEDIHLPSSAKARIKSRLKTECHHKVDESRKNKES